MYNICNLPFWLQKIQGNRTADREQLTLGKKWGVEPTLPEAKYAFLFLLTTTVQILVDS